MTVHQIGKSETLTKTKGASVIRSPSELVPLIKSAMTAAERGYQEVADLFAEARDGFDTYTDFLSWAHRHFDLGEAQAKRYLSVGRHRQIKAQTRAEEPESLNAALLAAGKRSEPTSGAVRRSWQPDVDAIAERARREQERVDRLYAEEITKKQEREAQRELSLRIIDIGYKVLAKELHPDKGGSRETMARLNRSRDHLKQMA